MLSTTDWVVNGLIVAAFVAAVVWAELANRQSARAWAALQAGIARDLARPSATAAAVHAARHAADAEEAAVRVRTLAAGAQREYANVLRAQDTLRALRDS